jgi:hypothetical protein
MQHAQRAAMTSFDKKRQPHRPKVSSIQSVLWNEEGTENESLFFHAPQTRTSKGDDEFVVAHRLGLSG